MGGIRTSSGVRAVGAAAVLLGLAGCSGGRPMPADASAEARDLAGVFAGLGAERRAWPSTMQEFPSVGRDAVLVFAAVGLGAPPEMAPDLRATLRDHVVDGGGLLLLGPATRLAAALGFESVPPRDELFRWGDDARTALGEELHGLVPLPRTSVDVEPPPLAEELLVDMVRDPRAEAFWVAGGTGPALVQSGWPLSGPRKLENGVPLAAHGMRRDGAVVPPTTSLVVRWSPDGARGRVVACGVVPDPGAEDEAVRSNARDLLASLLRGAAGGGRPPDESWLFVADGEPLLPVRPRVVDVPLAQRDPPGATGLAGWGWQAAATWHRPRGDVLHPLFAWQRVALPSWPYGADRVELRLADSRVKYPIAWPAQDPIQRPEGWFGGNEKPASWNVPELRLLADFLDDKGMLMHLDLAPPLVLGGDPARRAGAMRFVVRELADLRRTLFRSEEDALDGLTVREPFADPGGALARLLRPFHPELRLVTEDPERFPFPGAVGMLDAERGRPRGAPAAGLSATWRDRFAFRTYPQAVLDATSVPPDMLDWGREPTTVGGAWPDWLVTQVQDFVRPRGGRAVVTWRGDAPFLHADPRVVAMVHGLGLDPIRAAAAFRLTATGAGGWRDAILQLRGGALQAGFGPETPVPAHVAVVQNNHLRLHGSAGPVWFDPTGTSDWRPDPSGASGPVVLADPFVTTVARARPSGRAAEGAGAASIDLRGRDVAESGGFRNPRVVLSSPEIGMGRFPRMLARGRAPTWPREVVLTVRPVIGEYRLELDLEGRQGEGLVVVRLDDEPLAVLPFAEDRPRSAHTVSVGIGRSTPDDLEAGRSLSIEVAVGGTVEILRAMLVPFRPGSGGETRVGDPVCGNRARLVEHAGSWYYKERSEIEMLADLPGFVWRGEVLNADRGTVLERTLHFAYHRDGERPLRVLRGDEPRGDGPLRLRQAFEIPSQARGVPNLVVVPVDLPSDMSFRLEPGGLVLAGPTRANETFAVVFLLRQGGFDDARLADFQRIGISVARPRVVTVSPAGDPVTVVEQGRFAMPHVVRVVRRTGERPGTGDGPSEGEPADGDDPRTPWFVQERGFWWFRGAQDAGADGGGQWLRIHELPGHPTRIAPWDSAAIAFVPAAGSQARVGIGEPLAADTCTVRLVGPFDGHPAAAVVARSPFDQVRIDGEVWSAFDPGGRILLPARREAMRIETRRRNVDPGPTVWSTDAPLVRCRYDRESRTLELQAAARPEGADAGVPYHAVVSGPPPASLTGGALVAEPLTGPVPADHPRKDAFSITFPPGRVLMQWPEARGSVFRSGGAGEEESGGGSGGG